MAGSSGASGRRVLALLAIVLLAASVVVVIGSLARNPGPLLVAAAGVILTLSGGWWAITERGPRRTWGIAGAVIGAAICAFALLWGLNAADRPWLRASLALALILGSGACARLAVAASLHDLDVVRNATPFRPQRPVLICNPKSGGGKVEQFDLVEGAKALGVEVLLLEEGTDLEALAEDAVAGGADCLGMAGGDGSQALVAHVAVKHDLPFVCIAAGTRNHFALDLGLDREDPAAGLTAFTDGVIRRIDYALAGDRLFVNNASLGVYAEIVDSDEYRDAKMATAAGALPDLVGEGAEPFDLQFRAPDGQWIEGPVLILVSNNPYVLGVTPEAGQRRSLTTGRLGIVAVAAPNGREAVALVAKALVGAAGRDPNYYEFIAEGFTVESRSGEAGIGIDGEVLTLATPLEFRIVPRGLAVLVPADNPEAAALKHYRSFGVRGLWAIVRGEVPEAAQPAAA